MTLEIRLAALGAGCLVAFLALGYAATHAVVPMWRLDGLASGLRGKGLPLAVVFTLSGRGLPLLVLGAAGIAIAILTRYHVVAAVAVCGTQLASQALVEGVKHVFLRARPDAWIVHRELGYSYPSGHAATAIVFFGSWLVLVLASPLPKEAKILLATLLAIWAIGIDWSRLALGAHYLTDVGGGTLFGVSCAALLFAALHHGGYLRR